MQIFQQLKQAVLQIMHHKLRACLAMIGIIVGTASVVTLISSSQAATDHALSMFETLGTNLLAVQLYNEKQNDHHYQKNISIDDVNKIQQKNRSLYLASPYATSYQNTYYKGKQFESAVVGATPNLSKLLKLQTTNGRNLTNFDENSLNVVIGSDLANQLRQSGMLNPIGKQLQLKNNFVTIIGVLKPIKPNFFFFTNLNKGMIISLNEMQKIDSNSGIRSIMFRTAPKIQLNTVQNTLKQQIQNIIPSMQVNFRNPKTIMEVAGKQRKSFTQLLTFIGSISLLVGAIGVMNIMLVSVMERRQEIGIRLAIGARKRDIRNMFIAEAIVLTMLGGLCGVALGQSLTWIISHFSGWGYHFYASPIILGFSVSVLSGLIAGIYPAISASKLDPIKTLQDG